MEAVKPESKYERLRRIGIGSYGVVFKCVNRQTGQVVAIKRYSENDSDPIIRKIAMREVRMLRQLKHPNLINLIEVFRRKRRLHLVFDYCELTVLDVIEKYTNNCPVNLIKKIVWQTVNGINYCHTHNCIHRDIKPENILINQAGVVKLCDFGFARNIIRSGNDSSLASLIAVNGSKSVKRKEDWSATGSGLALERQALTEYVATRWYRAPELLIGEIYYDVKIDIWAIGCVTAELMRGEPVWPGKTDVDQLCIIKSSLGHLTPVQTQTLLAQSIYDQPTIERIMAQPASSSEFLERKLPGQRVGQDGVDFVTLCLQMDPAKRPNSDELLRHPYIQSARMGQFVVSQQPQQVDASKRSLLPQPIVLERRLPDTGRNARASGPVQTFGSNGNKTNSQSLMLLASSSYKQTKQVAASDQSKLPTPGCDLKSPQINGTPARQRPSQSINGGCRPAIPVSSQALSTKPIPLQPLIAQNATKTTASTTPQTINSDSPKSKARQRTINGVDLNASTKLPNGNSYRLQKHSIGFSSSKHRQSRNQTVATKQKPLRARQNLEDKEEENEEVSLVEPGQLEYAIGGTSTGTYDKNSNINPLD